MAQQQSSRPSSNLADFRQKLKAANKIVILTGAGVSAESGIPTFRGAGGLWRRYNAQDLATPRAFNKDPSLVWEFYHYRREVALRAMPNRAHKAIAEFENRINAQEGKKCTVITQNVDELHRVAGSKNLLELHGSIFRVRCSLCGKENANKDSPICSALDDKGDPEPEIRPANIPVEDLPHCDCPEKGLLRPAVVWFEESLNPDVLTAADESVGECDVCLVVGTSSVVYPAAMFAPAAAARGAVVAEFNIEETDATEKFGFYFAGKAGETLPPALME